MIARTLDYKGHSIHLKTVRTKSGWIWVVNVDKGPLRRGTLALPIESLALREGALVARAKVDNAELAPIPLAAFPA